jgi:MFS family permease
VATAVAAAVNAAFALEHGPAAAFALRFATGACLAGVYPTALKLMATWFRRDRGTALGVLVGALAVGSASPHLANAVGLPNWRATVLSSSATTALAAVIALVAVREGPFPFPRARFDPRQIAGVFRAPGPRLACYGYFGHMWELYAMWGWYAVFLADSLAHRGHDPRPWAPLGAFLAIASGLAGSWAAGWLADRWGRTRTAALAMVISGVCSLAAGFLFGAPPALVIAFGIVWGAAAVADSAQFSAMVTELADPAYVGTALTVQLAVGFLLTTATLWLIPVLRDAWSWQWAFAALAPGPALGIIAMLRLSARPEARQLAGGRG